MALPNDSDDCFLALLGNDGDLDPTFLKVKRRVGDESGAPPRVYVAMSS
jgi:hypothetical protein